MDPNQNLGMSLPDSEGAWLRKDRHSKQRGDSDSFRTDIENENELEARDEDDDPTSTKASPSTSPIDDENSAETRHLNYDQTNSLFSMTMFLSSWSKKNKDFIYTMEKGVTSLNTFFYLERYLNTLIYHRASLNLLVTPPGNTSDKVWAFFCIKRLVKELNWLSISLDYDLCGRNHNLEEGDPRILGCQTMRVSPGRTAICTAGHKEQQLCSAIEYTWHNLNDAMSIVNDGALIEDSEELSEIVLNISKRQIANVFKSIMSIVYHVRFYHRGLFESFELSTNFIQRIIVLSKLLKTRLRNDLIESENSEECRILNKIEYASELTKLIEAAKHRSAETKINVSRKSPFKNL